MVVSDLRFDHKLLNSYFYDGFSYLSLTSSGASVKKIRKGPFLKSRNCFLALIK